MVTLCFIRALLLSWSPAPLILFLLTSYFAFFLLWCPYLNFKMFKKKFDLVSKSSKKKQIQLNGGG